MEKEIISIRNFAKRVFLSESLIRKAIKLEKINYVRTGTHKGIDYLQGLEDMKQFGIGATKNLNADELPEGDFNVQTAKLAESKRIAEFYKSELLRIEFEKENGTLVNKDEVYKQLFEFGSEVKTSILSVPDRITDELISLSNDRHAFNNLLVDSLTEVLELLSNNE